MLTQKCIQCDTEMPPSNLTRKYCSFRCKKAYLKVHGGSLAQGHECRQCGNLFAIGPGQGNKWLCSDACRRASNAASVRNFHERQPLAEAVYRAKTKAKSPPDSRNLRFYRSNPTAPRACQSCGEDRVTEVAHRPGHERLGSHRSSANTKWPEMVWVLCPTCHRLLDRMHYTPEELGLK